VSFFYKLQKQVTHREKQQVTGQEFDLWKADAESFIKMMHDVITRKN